MRKTILNLMLLTLIYSCSDDNKGTDCSRVDLVVQQLFIELVDENGDNLLENGTFNLEEISIRVDNIEFPADEFGFFGDIIVIPFGRQGDIIYEILLSEMETDTLILNLSSREEICGTYFILNTAIYNGEEQTIITDNNFEPLIRVVR